MNLPDTVDVDVVPSVGAAVSPDTVVVVGLDVVVVVVRVDVVVVVVRVDVVVVVVRVEVEVVVVVVVRDEVEVVVVVVVRVDVVSVETTVDVELSRTRLTLIKPDATTVYGPVVDGPYVVATNTYVTPV